jgi:hypothetical protein
VAASGCFFENQNDARLLALCQPDDLMLQSAGRLMKSACWPPNMPDRYDSFSAPATRHASLQTLFDCLTKPSRFSHFWQGAESVAPATQNRIRT